MDEIRERDENNELRRCNRARALARNRDGGGADPERTALPEPRAQVASVVRTFADTEGAAARESYRRYFDLARRAKGKEPLSLVERAGTWYAIEGDTIAPETRQCQGESP